MMKKSKNLFLAVLSALLLSGTFGSVVYANSMTETRASPPTIEQPGGGGVSNVTRRVEYGTNASGIPRSRMRMQVNTRNVRSIWGRTEIRTSNVNVILGTIINASSSSNITTGARYSGWATSSVAANRNVSSTGVADYVNTSSRRTIFPQLTRSWSGANRRWN